MRGVHYKWLLVALLWVVALLNYLDRQMIFSVFPLLQKELDGSSVQLGLLGTSFLWVCGFLSPFGGCVADRFSRRTVILASLAVWSAVTWVTGHATSYGQLLTARGLMGVSEACYLPAELALIGDHYGWRTAFVAMGLAGLVYAAPLTLALKESARRAEAAAVVPFRGAMRDLLSSRPSLLIVIVNCLVAIAYWCVYTWLALYLFERFGMSLTAAGFSSTFYIQAAAFAGILSGGWMADRWTRTEVRGRVLTQTIGLGGAGPFLFLVGWTGSQWVLLPCLVLFGLGRDTVGLGGALQLSAAMLVAGAVLLWSFRPEGEVRG